ncbi:hypothetical protein AB6A40_002474 [Gnathostoma spinigerum]|uniref:Pleckstrin homology domain-containing family F member 2 n=1 Tax=Gnathostoma spinigerum TaxID=75299 RepID=A0ABD6EHG6_9BILA
MVDRLVNSEVNNRRVANVEACFGSSGTQLSVYGRVLVGEGVLVKMCRKKPKPRQFFLFNDILVYGNILISKKRYNKQRIIPLEEIQLEDLPDDGKMKNGWLIKTRSKSFAVFAATNSEKKEWMVHIDRCVHDILTKGGKKAATDHAAVWIPDCEATKCMACERTEFTVLQRRHHCRSCGNVVCSGCSSHNFRLPGLGKRPVRVCDKCYHERTKNGAEREEVHLDSSIANDSSDSDEEERAEHYDHEFQPTFYNMEQAGRRITGKRNTCTAASQNLSSPTVANDKLLHAATD